MPGSSWGPGKPECSREEYVTDARKKEWEKEPSCVYSDEHGAEQDAHSQGPAGQTGRLRPPDCGGRGSGLYSLPQMPPETSGCLPGP